MNADGSGIRQLCFDQDHNWCPTVLNNGRVLYTRWEYSDSPHYFTRLLFQMNPDGTGQMEYYASNSYVAQLDLLRPADSQPSDEGRSPSISGHHGVPRMGELVLFDPARGRREADGVVQRIPGYGQKVDPIIRDGLVDGSWPKFLHPYPAERQVLPGLLPADRVVAVGHLPGRRVRQPAADQGRARLRAAGAGARSGQTQRPPVIPDRVDLAQNEATVYLTDIYRGEGLRDVPRGTVKKLRVYSLALRLSGHGRPHQHRHRRAVGRADHPRARCRSMPDGSAIFKVPGQHADRRPAAGRAGPGAAGHAQLVHGHAGRSAVVRGLPRIAELRPAAAVPASPARRRPSAITPWYGPARGFSFKREVQPVLDRYCVGCHDGQRQHDGKPLADFTAKSEARLAQLHAVVHRPAPVRAPSGSGERLSPAAAAGVPRRTSELVQLLEKGHYNVKLDAEAWDRLVTWIDLNVPDHGTWNEHRRGHSPMEARRLEMRTRFANRPEDPEAIPELPVEAGRLRRPAAVAGAGRRGARLRRLAV